VVWWGCRAAALVVSVLAAVGGSPSRAEETPPPDARALERRVQQLEAQNAELLRRLERLEHERAAPAAPVETATAAAPAKPPPAAPHEHDHMGPALSAALADVRGSFQVFGNGDFVYRSAAPARTGNTSFVLGALDLFATGQVGEHFQAATEVVLEGDSDENEFGAEVERLWGSWTFGDWLAVKVGREHSPQSRWNRRFHHGRWMWTSATQPFLARFEDDGGPLAVHQVGIEANGRLRVPGGTLEYAGVVSNGRGRTPTEVENFGDHNDNKAVDFALGYAPTLLRGVGLGADVHVDDIPTIPNDPSRRHGIGELVQTAYVERFAGPWEALGEFAWIRHDDRTSGRTFDHRSAYAQLGYHIAPFTPYTRFDWRDMERGDPFYAPDDIDLDGWEQALGIRYDVTEYLALKLEGAGGEEERRAASGTVARHGYGRLAAQFALVF